MGQTLAPELLPGDIFLTRNAENSDNSTPGYWNHTAIYAGDNEVVEAQTGPAKVILTNLVDFWARYPIIKVVRMNDNTVAQRAATHARTLIDSRYWLGASRFKLLRSSVRGENCVSVVRRSYLYAAGINYRWKKPDDITNFPTIFIKK